MTGGRWTRPDIALLAVRAFSFVPGKQLEVVTFEVKPNLDQALEGVFEALAHSAFAHLAFLAVDISCYPDDDKELPGDDRIYQECKRLGVGYITFTDPADYNTFDVVVSASASRTNFESFCVDSRELGVGLGYLSAVSARTSFLRRTRVFRVGLQRKWSNRSKACGSDFLSC